MIVVKIWMYPGGSKKGKRIAGVICIANDGTGSVRLGNYDYAMSHTGKYLRSTKVKKSVYKKGKVRRFNRNGGVYKLLGKILKDAGQV